MKEYLIRVGTILSLDSVLSNLAPESGSVHAQLACRFGAVTVVADERFADDRLRGGFSKLIGFFGLIAGARNDAVGQVLHLDYHGKGIKVESTHAFSTDHNVLPPSEAWGATLSCTDCHFSRQTPVFDRLILVDPFASDGAATPVYKTVRELTGVSPY